ncbi:RBBP9/YdeN family alpha/beta hydrolase [Hyphococcus sp. DH-69]|uniref:RBBP9/YdeN family alpha/beta hydrolase n=1 Tax=Hyphococcus formosus TaxID=3143534 RepID=UPI00398B64FF
MPLIATAIFALAGCSGSTERIGADLTGKSVYIVHGYMAGPEDHWFGWLHENVENNGGEARIIQMPNSFDPVAERWTEALLTQIDQLDENTIIVAHSLGGISTLRFLDKHPDKKISGLILVSSFENELPAIPALKDFIIPKGFNAETIKQIAEYRTVFVSDNDPYVEPELTTSLAVSLDASVREIPGGGHFLASDGYEEFPELWEAIAEISASEIN